MKLRYLGTAAAEGFPGIFCVCDTCRRAREAGGRNIRGRSQAIINEELLIDFPADTTMRSLNGSLDLLKIHHCLITHHHSDHLYAADLEMRRRGMSVADEEAFHMYASKPASDKIEEMISRFELKGIVELHRVKPFDEFVVADKYKVTAFPADHAKLNAKEDWCAVFYLIEDGESKLLYGHDTGYFPESVWDYLENKKPLLTMVSLDCTGGELRQWRENHMGLRTCKEVRERLREIGCVTDETVCYVNHFSHNCGHTHDELVPIAAEYGFEVSYDGCEVEM